MALSHPEALQSLVSLAPGQVLCKKQSTAVFLSSSALFNTAQKQLNM